MNILIIGQTTLHWGRMEFGNIGNYYIIEPFIRNLHENFPGSKIKTTLQMSERFCSVEDVERLPMSLYYGFTGEDLIIAKKEIALVEEFLNKGFFSKTTEYIDEVIKADIVIDFSGDIWGDNANFLGKDRFEVGLYKDIIAQKLGKPTFMLAGSPGPFSNYKTKELAKNVLKNFTLVTNREPISRDLLIKDGFDVSNVKDLACPSFLFDAAERRTGSDILKKAGLLKKDKPLIGFVLCGWNFVKGPYDKWPRKEEEYIVFAEAIEYISNVIGAQVCLLSHSNGFPIPPKKFKLIHGRDYQIIKQLESILQKRRIAKDFISLNGVYDAWTTKAIIGNFDMLVSGRVHAAVAGLSQSVPTVIIDYGHEPKAHKLKGFAMLTKSEKFICDPKKENDIILKLKLCWNSLEEVKEMLNKNIPEIRKMAMNNFTIIKDIIDSMVIN